MTHGIQRQSGRLLLDGIDLSDVAEQHGTPLYVYGADSIRANAAQLTAALPDRVRVHFSVKANPSLAVCRVIQLAGLGAEISSNGELAAALAAGFPPADIVFAGPGKTDEELTDTARAGVACINVESLGEATRLASICQRLGTRQDVAIRINPVKPWLSSGRIPTGGGSQKFGIDEDQVPNVIDAIRTHPSLRLAGFHVSTASQVLDACEMGNAAEHALTLIARISVECSVTPERVNLGGGIGVAHTASDQKFDIAAYGTRLTELLVRHASSGPLAESLIEIEPGRALVSNAGVYLARVVDTKTSAGVHHAILDGGINHALLPITANRYAAALAIARDGNPVDTIIGGPLCTSADQWRASVPLAGARPGDIVAMMNSGAYGLSASMTMFLSRAAPAEVLLDHGAAHLIRRRGVPEDLLATQFVPEHLTDHGPLHPVSAGPAAEPGA